MPLESQAVSELHSLQPSWLMLAAVLATAVSVGTAAHVLFRAWHVRKRTPERDAASKGTPQFNQVDLASFVQQNEPDAVQAGWGASALVWSLPVLLILGGLAIVSRPYFQPMTTYTVRELHPQAAAVTTNQTTITSAQAKDVQAVPLVSERKTAETAEAEKPSSSGAGLPQWVGIEKQRDGKTTLLVVTSAHFTKVEDADEDAMAKAVNRVARELELEGADISNEPLPVDILRNHCICQRFVEPVQRQMGTVTAQLYRVHLQVQLTPKTRAKLERFAVQQVVHNRLWVLGTFAGLATLILGTISSYFRLDALTYGSFRGRLKLAAVSTIVAGGLIAWIVLPKVS